LEKFVHCLVCLLVVADNIGRQSVNFSKFYISAKARLRRSFATTSDDEEPALFYIEDAQGNYDTVRGEAWDIAKSGALKIFRNGKVIMMRTNFVSWRYLTKTEYSKLMGK
jgi:hypothetical protein